MLWFLYSLLILAFLVVVLVFGDSPTFRNTPLQKLHHSLLWCNSKIFYYATASPTVYGALRWSVPVFYSIIIIVCVAEFFTHVYGKLAIHHSVGHSLYIFFTLASLVISTEIITFSDPGYITEKSVESDLAKYPANGLIFFADKTCRTCLLPKPARSKHCSVCNKCVYVYDHHCIFVNNCVGEKNYRWFVAFLFANLNLMVYGGYLCWTLLKNTLKSIGWWQAITRTSEANRIAGILLILAVVFSVVVSAFTALHFRYMYLGVTTNEADKWGEIEYLVSLGMLYYVEDLGVYVERASYMDGEENAYVDVYILLDNQQVLFLQSEAHIHDLHHISLVDTQLTNIYDQGFLENMKDRLLS